MNLAYKIYINFAIYFWNIFMVCIFNYDASQNLISNYYIKSKMFFIMKDF